MARKGTKSENVHVFVSRVHTHVIVLGRTTSGDVRVVVRCAVGEGEKKERSALFFYILTYGLNIASRVVLRVVVLRVVALRVVALCLSSVHKFASRADTYTHLHVTS